MLERMDIVPSVARAAVVVIAMVSSARASAVQVPEPWNDLGADSPWFDTVTEPQWLEPVPPLELASDDVPASDAEIEALIDALTEVDRPGSGYAATVDTWCFLPEPDIRGMSSMLLLKGHGLRESAPLKRLEELGPRALPALLAHLDDARPTALSCGPGSRPGGVLGLERRIHGNPLNEHEASALGEWIFHRWFPGPRDGFDAATTIRVGDLCLVALGQIVNRPHYAAARYQPSGHTYVTSPVRDPELATMLRAAWGWDEPREELLCSLSIDLHTRGQGTDELQAGAATRLAYFYPQESAELLAQRLDGLHTGCEDGPLRDGVWASYLVDALAACTDPLVSAARERAVQRAGTPPALSAWLGREVPEGDALGPWLAARHAEEVRPAARRRLMLAALDAGQTAGVELVERALRDPSPARRAEACRTITWAGGERDWVLPLLAALLGDEAPTGARFASYADGAPLLVAVPRGLAAVFPAASNEFGELGAFYEDKRAHVEDLYVKRLKLLAWDDISLPAPLFQRPRHALRACDEAALAVASILPDASFRLHGRVDERDREIADLRAALDR